MAITYSNVQVTKVLTLRGNTIQNNRYTGLPGELTVDTEAKTIRIHDGVTPGGNTVQGSGGAGSYANANVKVYLTAFDGNMIPSANNVYSLGTITNQWQHLYVSSNTIYIGGTAVTVTNGNLTVGNTTIVNTAAYTQTMGYTNYSNVNLASYLGGSVTIGGNLTVTGNLFLNGNTTLVSTNNLIINDNIIYIANANPGSSLDIGLVGHFTSTSYQHTGLVRQASSNQWQLFSNVVAEPGATIDFTNAIYDDIRVGNITSPTITGINANVAAANIGIKGYIDLANTIQSAQLTAANTAWAANAYQQSALIGNLQSSAYSNVNVAAYLTTNSYLTSNLANLSNYAYASNVTTANTGIKGYVDLANSIQSAQITAANVGIIGYIDQANTIQSGQVNAANLAISAANVGMKGYVDSQSFYSNVKVSTYLPTYSGNIAANISKAGRTWTFGTDGKLTFAGTLTNGATFDGNDFIAAPNSFIELAGYTGNTYVGLDNNSVFIQTNWNTAGKQWTFGTDGTTQFPGSMILAPVSQSITMQSDQYSQLMWQNANVTVAPDKATYSNFYVAQNSAVLDIGYRDGSSNEQFKEWLWSVDGNLTLPSGGYILNSDNSIYGGSSYSNVQVATYLQDGNIANISVAGNVTATYFVGNGAFLTGVVGSASNYGNVDVRNFLKTGDGASRLIQGYYANIDLGATARLFSFGATAKSYFGHDGFLGNTSINYIRADNGDVRIATNNAAYNWTFDNTGNLTLPGNVSISSNSSYFLGNSVGTTAAYTGNVSANYFVGNGTLLTGVATKITGSWTVPTGNSTQSFTVPASGTYQLWVDCNIPNGILAWNATATVTNTNVPVVGAQYAWVYTGGGTPVDFTSIPNQFTGTGNTIVRSSVAPSATTNRFDFGINNTSGGNITVRYGYVSIS